MKEGYKKTEVGIVPNEWQVKTIGELFEFKNGLNKEKKFFGKGTKIINYVDVFRNRALDNNIIQGLVEVSEKEKQLFNTKKGDVFFTRTSETVDEIGMTAVLLENINDLVYSGFVLRARPKTEELDLFYKKYCFSEFYTRKEIMRKSSCTTRALTSGTLLKDVLIKIPSIKEQQKIAEILSTVDSQIDDTYKLIEKTKELKKGLMQRLLTKGIGHTEFKKTEIGEIPVEWEVTTLNKCGEIFGGNAFKSIKFITEPTEKCYQVIRMGNVQQCNLALHRNPVYLDEKSLVVKEERYILKTSDILISLTGTVNKTDYGNVVWVDFDNKYLLNQRVACFRKDSNLYSSRYIYYLMQTKVFRDQFFELGVGGTGNQANVSISDLNNIKIYKIPIEEQAIIASILSSVDIQIEEYQNKKVKLEKLKKGLMQQLLTGKIRV